MADQDIDLTLSLSLAASEVGAVGLKQLTSDPSGFCRPHRPDWFYCGGSGRFQGRKAACEARRFII